jgi:hypothetical protein
MKQVEQTEQNDLLELESSQPDTGSRIISKVLSPAIQFWLRSQVESATALQFQVAGKDRQILRGCLPEVTVSADQAVYQGLHLSHLHLSATQIQINLGQVIKGKPLRLLNAVPVAGKLVLTQANLTISLASPLLQQGLTELLQLVISQLHDTETKHAMVQQGLTELLQLVISQLHDTETKHAMEDPALAVLLTQSLKFNHLQITLGTGRLLLLTEVTSPTGTLKLTLASSLQLVDCSHLRLTELELRYPPVQQNHLPSEELLVLTMQPLDLDLGETVNLQQLTIEPERVTCVGQIMVMP